MGPLQNSPDAIEALLRRSLELDPISGDLEEILRNPSQFTKSGRPVANVATSRAVVPNALTTSTGPSKAFVQINPGALQAKGATVAELAAQRSAVQSEQQIIRLAQMFDEVPVPRAPVPATPGVGQLAKKAIGGPIGVLLTLLTHTGDLNADEASRLLQYKEDDLRSSGGPR
jgi:hypothetical protein